MDSVFIVTRMSETGGSHEPFIIVAVYVDQELAEAHAKVDPSVTWSEEPISKRLPADIEERV